MDTMDPVSRSGSFKSDHHYDRVWNTNSFWSGKRAKVFIWKYLPKTSLKHQILCQIIIFVSKCPKLLVYWKLKEIIRWHWKMLLNDFMKKKCTQEEMSQLISKNKIMKNLCSERNKHLERIICRSQEMWREQYWTLSKDKSLRNELPDDKYQEKQHKIR